MRAWLLLALLVIEVLFITILRNEFGYHVSPLILLLTSMAIGVVPLLKRQMSTRNDRPRATRSSTFIAGLCLWIIGTTALALLLAKPFSGDPTPWSDVIPQAMTLAERFTSGERVYDLIAFDGYEMSPTYLPFQWLPFVISVWTGVDPRWIAFGVWSLAGLVFQFWLMRNCLHFATHVLLSVLPFGVIALFHADRPSHLSLTFETMMAGYYWLIAMAILSRKFWMLAGAVIIGLLSRYSLVLWVPLLIIVLFTEENRKRALSLAAATAAGVLLLYVVPFLVNSPDAFFNGYQYHVNAATDEWKWASPDNSRWHSIFSGTGMAPWFFGYAQGDHVHRLNGLRLSHVVLSAVCVITMIAVFYSSRRKPDSRLFALSALKIYLAIFYGFIQLPYVYLFIVPILVSLVIVAQQFSPKLKVETSTYAP